LGFLKSLHAREMEGFRTEITNSAAAAVCQARIKLAAEALDPNSNKSFWDIEGWKQRLTELKGKPDKHPEVKATEDIPDEGTSKVDKGEPVEQVVQDVVKDIQGDEGNDA
jgi:hypothetical protein